MSEPIKIIVIVQGGIVQDAWTTAAEGRVDLRVIDLDNRDQSDDLREADVEKEEDQVIAEAEKNWTQIW